MRRCGDELRVGKHTSEQRKQIGSLLFHGMQHAYPLQVRQKPSSLNRADSRLPTMVAGRLLLWSSSSVRRARSSIFQWYKVKPNQTCKHVAHPRQEETLNKKVEATAHERAHSCIMQQLTAQRRLNQSDK
uniref:Uncharacterized protein n=1 Tax=Oryza rufipogon TaxID=4529 RepID=A0A0E0NMS9_ORYRU